MIFVISALCGVGNLVWGGYFNSPHNRLPALALYAFAGLLISPIWALFLPLCFWAYRLIGWSWAGDFLRMKKPQHFLYMFVMGLALLSIPAIHDFKDYGGYYLFIALALAMALVYQIWIGFLDKTEHGAALISGGLIGLAVSHLLGV